MPSFVFCFKNLLKIILQEQEYAQMLRDAESAVAHMNDIISEYQTQIEWYKEKARGSITVQKGLSKRLEKDKTQFIVAIVIFEAGCAAYIAMQLVIVNIAFFILMAFCSIQYFFKMSTYKMCNDSI